MEINYQASPTGAKFHASSKVVRGFMGCVGNGKSVCCISEALRLSCDQWPNHQGIRKVRGAIVRNTTPELRTTTLNTWKQWVPEEVAPLVMHPVIQCNFNQPLGDGTKLELEVYFLAMDNDRDVKKLLGMEVSWVFLNEARELPYSVIKAARERIGRYPARIDGYEDTPKYKAPRDEKGDYLPCKRKAVLMDTNPMDDDHWWYQLAEDGHLEGVKETAKEKAIEETKKVFEFFRGPAPLIKIDDGEYIPNPQAENIENLPGGYQYYLDMIGGNTEDHINVMVMGNYGTITEGRPVYTNYSDRIHCPEKYVKAIKGIKIGLAWDFGLTPALVIGQLTPRGQLRVIAELFSEDMDVRRFARDVVKPFLSQHFSEFEIAFSLGDPSGDARGEGEGKSAIGILNDEYDPEEPLDLGFITEPAPTNDITKRVDAVSQFMIRLVDGEPAYQLNKACTILRKGKQGGYCYKRVAAAGKQGVYKDKPDKNKYSHPADAEQYLALGYVHGYHEEVWEEDDEDPRENQNLGQMGY